MRKKIASIFRILAFLSIGLFFIWLFVKDFSTEQKNEIFESLKAADYKWVLYSIVLGIISHASRTYRWKMMLESLGYKPRFKNVFLAVFINYFANLALPRLGEMMRCGVLTRYEDIPFNKSFGTVITERAIDLLIFVLMFVFITFAYFSRLYGYIDQKVLSPLGDKFAFFSKTSNILILIAILLTVFLLFSFVFKEKLDNTRMVKKIKNLVSGFWDGIMSIFKLKKPGLFFFHTAVIWGMYWGMTWIVFPSMSITSDLGGDTALVVLTLGAIGMMVVQGGIGIYPAIVAETLSLYLIPEIEGYAMGWILWSGQTLMIIIMGIISIALLPLLNEKKVVYENI
ncbi:MAG: flippase-like domain-containing protein [Bacteroidales bacterium]|nr:flippase-like domain-containing protein [Bacteroidales bacterium]